MPIDRVLSARRIHRSYTTERNARTYVYTNNAPTFRRHFTRTGEGSQQC